MNENVNCIRSTKFIDCCLINFLFKYSNIDIVLLTTSPYHSHLQ